MDFNKMMMQAKKMQAEIDKRESAFDEKIFTFEKQGIKLEIKGSSEIVLLDINDVLIDPDDKETLQDLIIITLNQAIAQIQEEKKSIREKATQGMI